MRWLRPCQVLDLPATDLPLIVLTDNLRSMLSSKIKKHTKSYYSHAMFMITPGFFVTQNWWLREVDARNYLDGFHRIKFWQGDSWADFDKISIIGEIEADLDEPKWRHRYDLFGVVVGQWLRIRWLNIPWTDYCSEYVLEVISHVMEIPGKHGSPGYLDRWCTESDEFSVYGIYDPTNPACKEAA